MNANTLVNRLYAVLRSTLGTKGETTKARQAREHSDLAQECICVLLQEFHNGKRHKRADIEQTIAYVFKRLRIKSIPAQKCIHVYTVQRKARAATPERRYTVLGTRPNRARVERTGTVVRDNVSLPEWTVTIPAYPGSPEYVETVRSTRAPDNVPDTWKYVRTENIGYRRESHTATLTRPLDELLETCTVETDNVRKIVRLLGQGYRKGEIAKIVGMSERHVRRTLNRFKETIPDTLTLDTRYLELACQCLGAQTRHLTYAKHDTYAYDIIPIDATSHEWSIDVTYNGATYRM